MVVLRDANKRLEVKDGVVRVYVDMKLALKGHLEYIGNEIIIGDYRITFLDYTTIFTNGSDIIVINGNNNDVKEELGILDTLKMLKV